MDNIPVRRLCFVHVGKTGGTYLSKGLRMLARQSGIDMEFFSHKRSISYVFANEPDMSAVFGIRDPLEIFVSGFYSRQRKGAPRYNVEWSDEEKEAFARFSTPNELAEAISSEDSETRLAATRAMDSIGHVKKNLHGYLKGPAFLENNKDRIFFIFNQQTLDEDIRRYYSLFGRKVPQKLVGNEDLKHKNPDNLDRRLSDVAIKNLREHYKKDMQIYRKCLNIRREILKKIEENSDAYAASVAKVV
ncbi:hypothetical protein [Microbaculum marinum]|uniref:Sulfotransferase family protein n=1 Tax=Microbaculum marinum TaxID=1764581 RepID=A0AAW9RPU8_9HYPH